MYAPVELLAKTPEGKIIPYFGSTNDDPMRFGASSGVAIKMDVAMDRLRTLFNCSNFIVSQLNLSLLPFIFGGTSFHSASRLQKLLRYLARELYQRVLNLCTLLGLDFGERVGRNPLVRGILFFHFLTSQAIYGDITLIPPVSLSDYRQLLENPSTQRLNDCVAVARRYTWTKASLIQAHCVVEFALDRCVRAVRLEIGGGTAPPQSASSAAFAHPNRSYSSIATPSVAPSLTPNQQLQQSSPAPTPAPASTSFWSKKLNARAVLPLRKSSFDPNTASPYAGLPALDLSRDTERDNRRGSPNPPPRMHLLHALSIQQQAAAAGGTYSFSATPTASVTAAAAAATINSASTSVNISGVSGGISFASSAAQNGAVYSLAHSTPTPRSASIFCFELFASCIIFRVK
jgi:hypothetical protein